jgi:hypothetical protein
VPVRIKILSIKKGGGSYKGRIQVETLLVAIEIQRVSIENSLVSIETRRMRVRAKKVPVEMKIPSPSR